jgi:hypothetical protein
MRSSEVGGYFRFIEWAIFEISLFSIFLLVMAANNRGAVWANGEIDALYNVWWAEDIEGQLASLHRNLPVYARVAELLAIKGCDRSPEQCRIKMKHLCRGIHER